MTQTPNRRRFDRINFGGEAYLSEDGVNETQVELLDLSLHGALIKAHDDFNTKDPIIRYHLRVPLSPELDIVVDVTIARVMQDQIGLQIAQMELESAQHLRRLVELNLGNEELLNRNLAALFAD